MTPFPGTHTFARLYRDERIFDFDWSRYDAYHAVFTPARMTAQQLQEGLITAYCAYYGRGPRFRRLFRQLRQLQFRQFGACTVSNARFAANFRDSFESEGSGFRAEPSDLAELAKVSAAEAPEAITLAVSGVRRIDSPVQVRSVRPGLPKG